MQSFEDLALKFQDGFLYVLDQTCLPDKEDWVQATTPEIMSQLIKKLSIRGAPMIGIGAVLSLAAFSETKEGSTKEKILEAAKLLRESRPTAVNLMNNIDTMLQISEPENERDYSSDKLIKLAYEIRQKEIDMSIAMSEHGAKLIKDGDNILTHCNTGALAAGSNGTALGVIAKAHQQGKKIHVYVDETRPLLQGGRLTAYELKKHEIPYTIICDNMAASLMKQNLVQRIFVGADRIALNGDFANKIGTYSLAVVANYHKVPFHCVAPETTIDFECLNGDQIPIEQRKSEEVLGASGHFGTCRWAPSDANTYNPAFDVTTVNLIESIILDSGIHTKDQIFEGSLKNLKK